MSDAAKATTNHDEIMAWADEKGAYPAQVKGTGIIRLDFPGFSGEETLEPITWDRFFEKLAESQLAMLLQDSTGSGRNSRFNMLVSRRGGTDADATTSSQRASRRQGGPKKTATRRTKAGGRAGRGSRTRTVAKRATRKSSSNKRSPAKSRHR